MLFKEETVNPGSTVQSDAQKVKNGLKQPPNTKPLRCFLQFDKETCLGVPPTNRYPLAGQ